MEKELPLIKENLINKIRPLGSGGYGTVYEARYKNKLVALKSIIDDSESNKNSFLNKLKKLHILKHPTIIQIYIICSTDYRSVELSFIMELMDCSLSNVIHDHTDFNYDYKQILKWVEQIPYGLSFIHSQNFIYRDIKPGNLLLSNNYTILKVADFGTTTTFNHSAKSFVGTLVYIAPEIVQGKHYDKKCDVYSFAITLWEICLRNRALRPSLEILKKKNYSQDIIKIIEKCCDHNPKNRSIMKQILDYISNLYFNIRLLD